MKINLIWLCFCSSSSFIIFAEVSENTAKPTIEACDRMLLSSSFSFTSYLELRNSGIVKQFLFRACNMCFKQSNLMRKPFNQFPTAKLAVDGLMLSTIGFSSISIVSSSAVCLLHFYSKSATSFTMLLMSKLHNMVMKGGDINTYLSEAMDIRNQLKAFREVVEDKTLNNIVLNGLPRSYEMVIQRITYMTSPSFEEVMKKILT